MPPRPLALNPGRPLQVIVRIRPEPGLSTEPQVVVARNHFSVALLPLPHPPPDPMGKSKPVTETKVPGVDQEGTGERKEAELSRDCAR